MAYFPNFKYFIGQMSEQSEKTSSFAVCAIKALILCDNEFLVLSKERWVHELGLTWNDLPGGRINHGELCPEKALQRELQEEIGANSISIIKPIHMATVTQNPKMHIVATIFLCKATSKKLCLSDEHSNYRWADIANTQLALPQWIKEAIAKLRP